LHKHGANWRQYNLLPWIVAKYQAVSGNVVVRHTVHSSTSTGLLVFGLSLTLLVAGCATGPQYSAVKASIPAVKEETSRVYFLRPKKFLAHAAAAHIYINHTLVIKLKNGEFTYFDLTPGAKTVKIDEFAVPGYWEAAINVEAGREHFLQIAPSSSKVWAGMLGGFVGQLTMKGGMFWANEVTGQVAEGEMATLREAKQTYHGSIP